MSSFFSDLSYALCSPIICLVCHFADRRADSIALLNVAMAMALSCGICHFWIHYLLNSGWKLFSPGHISNSLDGNRNTAVLQKKINKYKTDRLCKSIAVVLHNTLKQVSTWAIYMCVCVCHFAYPPPPHTHTDTHTLSLVCGMFHQLGSIPS